MLDREEAEKMDIWEGEECAGQMDRETEYTEQTERPRRWTNEEAEEYTRQMNREAGECAG